MLIIAFGPILIGCLGVFLAVQGTAGWTLKAASIWWILGILFVLYIAKYETVCNETTVQQTRFLRRIASYHYSEIKSVEFSREGRSGNVLLITFADGRQMTVFGADPQLIKAKFLLIEKLPQRLTDALR